MKSMTDLMLDHLRDIFYAEKRGIKCLSQVAKEIENPELKDALLKHGEQSKAQVERLKQVFSMMDKRAIGKECAAMEGLIEEGEEAIKEGERGPVLDAGLLANAQAIEHYEIARYGSMVAWAKAMDLPDAAALLQETLDEEKASDSLLSEIANRALNPAAANSGEESDDEDDEKDESPDPEPAKPAPKRRAKAAKAPEPEPEPEPEPAPAAKRKAPAKKPPARKPAKK